MDGCAPILLRRRRRGRAALGRRLPAEVVREEPRLAVKRFDRAQIGAGLGLGERLAVPVVVLSSILMFGMGYRAELLAGIGWLAIPRSR